jgi:hypothetical protein
MAVATVLASGCSAPETAESEVKSTKPHLLALSTYSASLGSPVDAFLSNPPGPDIRKIELVFDGTFKRASGGEEKVSFTQPTTRTESAAVRWTSYGPFQNPFTPKDPDIGVFNGTAAIQVTNADGTVTKDENPIKVRFEVQPSIIVTELQPTGATCDKAALSLIGGMKYKMKMKAIGIEATSIDYAVKTPRFAPDPEGNPDFERDSGGQVKFQQTLLAHAVGDTTKGDAPKSDTTDGIKDDEAISLPAVPDNIPNYGVIFVITAKDSSGRVVKSSFGMTAHNPIDVFYDGRYELAQIYPPQPVSACMPGGQQGRNVDYTETQEERKERQLSMTVSKNWLKSDENNWSTADGKTVSRGKTEEDSYSKTVGRSNTVSITNSHSTMDGVEYNWSNATTNGGTAKLTVGGMIGKLGLGGETSYTHSQTSTKGGSRYSNTTNGWEKTNSTTNSEAETKGHSTATTDTTSISKTDTKGGAQRSENGGAEDEQNTWIASSAQSIQRGFGGAILDGTFGIFYRQMARYTQTGYIMEYNMCGEGEIIGKVTMQDYVWAPDLALSKSCPPFPKSNLPEPQCYLQPCDPN